MQPRISQENKTIEFENSKHWTLAGRAVVCIGKDRDGHTVFQSRKEPLYGTEDVVDGETAESPHEQKRSSQSLKHTL